MELRQIEFRHVSHAGFSVRAYFQDDTEEFDRNGPMLLRRLDARARAGELKVADPLFITSREHMTVDLAETYVRFFPFIIRSAEEIVAYNRPWFILATEREGCPRYERLRRKCGADALGVFPPPELMRIHLELLKTQKILSDCEEVESWPVGFLDGPSYPSDLSVIMYRGWLLVWWGDRKRWIETRTSEGIREAAEGLYKEIIKEREQWTT